MTTRTQAPDDRKLQADAKAKLQKSTKSQVIAEILLLLREAKVSWWTPEILRSTYGAEVRMGWLESRPDERQRITSALTGLAGGAARALAPDRQAEIINAAIDAGDITVEAFEEAFDPLAIATHGARSGFWQLFRKQFPSNPTAADRKVAAGVLSILLATKGAAGSRKPALEAVAFRRALGATAVQKHLPLDIRGQLDEARLQAASWTPADDLKVLTPGILAQHLPVTALDPVYDAAETAVGLRARKGSSGGKPQVSGELGTDVQFDFPSDGRRNVVTTSLT